MSSTSVRFNPAELVEAQAAAARAGLKFNAWVRRACREQAALERALAAQEVESKVGLEREGWDTKVVVSSLGAPREFKPDFRPARKR